MMFKRCSTLTSVLGVKKFAILFRNYNFQFNASHKLINFCERTFDLPKYKVQSMMIRWPSLQNIEEEQLTGALKCLNQMGVKNKDILTVPSILNFHPNTIKSRYRILKECGISNINAKVLSRYVAIVVKKNIKELQTEELLAKNINLRLELLKCFSLYPEISEKLYLPNEIHTKTMYELRMDILQQFLLFKLNFSKEKFMLIIKMYPGLKHKSLTIICQNMHYLENSLNYTNERISSHPFALAADPENLRKLITEVKTIGGSDMKTVLYKYPTLLRYNYQDLIKIKKILKDESIPEEAQSRFIQIFYLSPSTIVDRIEKIKSNPILKELFNNSRVLFIVYYYNKVVQRLSLLEQVNKKCSSLHKLVSGEKEFNRYVASFGDKTRGVDTLSALTNNIKSSAIKKSVKERIQRHPYWTNISLTQIMKTLNYLKTSFSMEDIYENCEVVLYPLDEIKDNLNFLRRLERFYKSSKYETLKLNLEAEKLILFDMKITTKSQMLSLLIYLLERNYNFSGDAIWSKYLKDFKISGS